MTLAQFIRECIELGSMSDAKTIHYNLAARFQNVKTAYTAWQLLYEAYPDAHMTVEHEWLSIHNPVF